MQQVYVAGKRKKEKDSFRTLSRPGNLPNYQRQDWSDPTRKHACLGNGVIGLRLGGVPFRDAQVLVNGYIGRDAATGLESQAFAPFPLQADIVLHTDTACRLSERPELVHIHKQSLDVACGELTTSFTYGPKGHQVHVEVVTFCSQVIPTACCQEIRLKVDQPLMVEVEAIMDPTALPGQCLERLRFQSKMDTVLLWESRGSMTTLGAGFFTEIAGLDDYMLRQNNWGNERDQCLCTHQLKLIPDRNVSLRQYGVLTPSTMQDEPHIATIHMLHHIKDVGFERLQHENRKAWLDLWEGRPVIEASGVDNAATLQEYADSAFYYVHSSIHRSSPLSFAPFGLWGIDAANAYSGHVFTSDCENYTYPAVLLTNPGAARAILDYRTRQIDMYHRNALAAGQDGLLIPNQTCLLGSNISRMDAVGCLGASAFKNHFIAEAFLQYANAHGDEDFLREKAWPILKGTADWMASRVTLTERGYEVHNLYINEQYGDTQNEPPVSRAFQRTLLAATEMAEKLGKRPRPQWQNIAQNLVILTDPEDLRRETSWYKPTYKAFTRATNREDLIKEMQGLSGVPISAIRPVKAALDMGHRDLAGQWWPQEVASKYIPQWFGVWREWSTQWTSGGRAYPFQQDCFVTFAGHILKQLLIQFPQLDITSPDPMSWPSKPVTLPQGWDAIEVQRIWIQDRPAKMIARHGQKTDIQWLD
ncbi:MAG: hypothetical protein ACF8OB_03525 [Phycisphaeraceae bacterium JB051]